MAAKRLRDGSDNDSDNLDDGKRLQALPSFSTIIRRAMKAQQLQNLWAEMEPIFRAEMEPIFRTVIREEVEAAIVNALNTTRLISRSPPMQIEAASKPNLQLVFGSPLLLPIYFTNNRIEDCANKPLQILLIDTTNGGWAPVKLSMPLRVEVVVLHGDFPAKGNDRWTSAEFDRAVVSARVGHRPLLTGDVSLTLREGAALINELTVTDNSAWVKSHQFKIGVRAAPGSYDGPRILEGMTDSFRVKDHRGEAYKKHYPPAPSDEVWRLEKIGKDGAYHNRLSAGKICTVQDFLRLLTVDAPRLRRILDMSDRMWESTLAHARTCPIDDKVYMYHKQNWTIFLNSICEVLSIEIDGVLRSLQELNVSHKTFVREMVRGAYQSWNLFEEFNGMLCYTAPPQNETILQGAIEGFAGTFDIDELDQV